MKKKKKYRVYVEWLDVEEDIILATSKKKALEKFYERFYIDGKILKEQVDEIKNDIKKV